MNIALFFINSCCGYLSLLIGIVTVFHNCVVYKNCAHTFVYLLVVKWMQLSTTLTKVLQLKSFIYCETVLFITLKN